MIKSHKKSQENNILQLQDHNKRPVDLKADRVDQLFARAEKDLYRLNKTAPTHPTEKTSELAEKLLGRFGLQSSQDVIKFLKSLAGKSTLAIIHKELAILAAIKNQLAHERLEELLQKNRIIAFLLLGLLYKKEAKAHERYAFAMAEQERLLHSHKTEVANNTKPSIAYHQQNALAYAYASDALENTLQNVLKEADALENDLRTNEKQHLISKSRFKNIHEALGENDQFGINVPLTDLVHSEHLSRLKTQIDTLTNEINTEQQQIAELVDQLPVQEDPEYQAKQDHIQALLAKNFAKGVRATELEDMLAVLNHEKVLYKENGERALTMNEADFILDAQKELVKKDGQLYLINKGQSLDEMSKDDKEKAAKAYKTMGQEEISGVRKLVKQYHTHELTDYQAHHDALSQRSEETQETIMLLANKAAELRTAAANEALALKQAPTSPNLTMTPIPTPAKRDLTCYTESYKHILNLMKTTNPSETSIARLKEMVSRIDNTPELKQQLNALKPGIPIPDTIMNRLLALKAVGTNWLDVRKPDSTVKDFNPPFSPSPFTMNPFKGG